eukprot:scaffold31161_cov37-Prasinocladus_malaysianus.AAC.1
MACQFSGIIPAGQAANMLLLKNHIYANFICTEMLRLHYDCTSITSACRIALAAKAAYTDALHRSC